MIDFHDVPSEVRTHKRNLFEEVVSAQDRGALVRNPGRWARIVRRDEGGHEIPFSKQERGSLMNYAIRHSFRIKSRGVEGQRDRWNLWVMYDPSMAEESHARMEQRRQASAERYAQRRQSA